MEAVLGLKPPVATVVKVWTTASYRDMPTTSSARISAKEMARKMTTMPMPPSHWVMLRQKRMEGVSASMSASSVAPVVVKPLIPSKVESSRLVNVPSMMYGMPPSSAASTQARVTERYTSRSKTYPTLRSRLAQSPAAPTGIITAAGTRKLFQEPSRYSKE